MTHPHQQTFAVLASGFEQAAVSVVVHPLGQVGKLFRTLRFAISFRDDLVERSATLCPFASIVVHAPFVILRPDSFRREGAEHTFVGHHVRHAPFAMELVVTGFQRKIFLCREHPVRAMPAHHFISRAGDIMNVRMIFLDDTAQRLVDLFRRETFVTTAIKSDRRMAANPFYIIFRIGDKHFRIIRIRSVGRVSQPEVLPDHDTVAVASLIQLLVADHADPVTHHREVHIRMQSHSNVIFAGAIVQVRLTEAPVTATSDKAATVDEETQDIIVLVERHLADTDFKVFRIRNLVIHFEGEVRIIQVRLAVAFRPPQARVLHLQLREILGIEDDSLFFSRRQFDRLLECDISNLSFQNTLYGIRVVVLHDHFGRQRSGSRVRQRQDRRNKRIGNRHLSGRGQEDIVPDTDITSADSRNPVPTDRSMERRVVSP